MQINWTKGAEKNLLQVETYINQDNPRAAIDTILHILKAVEVLTDHPAMGRPGRIFNTRELVISGTLYIVAYRVKHNQIQILRVLHGTMRWPDKF